MNITNENKNSLSITNEDKGLNQTWDDADFTWDDASGTWETQKVVLSKDSKNNLSITNESK